MAKKRKYTKRSAHWNKKTKSNDQKMVDLLNIKLAQREERKRIKGLAPKLPEPKRLVVNMDPFSDTNIYEATYKTEFDGRLYMVHIRKL